MSLKNIDKISILCHVNKLITEILFADYLVRHKRAPLYKIIRHWAICMQTNKQATKQINKQTNKQTYLSLHSTRGQWTSALLYPYCQIMTCGVVTVLSCYQQSSYYVFSCLFIITTDTIFRIQLFCRRNVL